MHVSMMVSTIWYLHGARLAVADHGGSPLNVDWLREEERLVRLVLGQVLQTALVGLLVLVLGGHRTLGGKDFQEISVSDIIFYFS